VEVIGSTDKEAINHFGDYLEPLFAQHQHG